LANEDVCAASFADGIGYYVHSTGGARVAGDELRRERKVDDAGRLVCQ
jgi:hypothetical protein